MRHRSTADILILLVAATVCFALLGFGLTLGLVRILHPEVDLSSAEGSIVQIINTMVGLLAGFIAGRTGPPPSTDDAEKPRAGPSS